MIIYTAGPMTGRPCFNFPHFYDVAYKLHHQGHTVINPAEHDRLTWPDIETWPGYATGDISLCPKMDIVKCLSWDMEQIGNVDAVAVLDGWRNSRGARCEVHYARLLRKLILDAYTLEPIEDAILDAEVPLLPMPDQEIVHEYTDSQIRKQTPIYSGVLAYFPLAIQAVARLSYIGNEKHNPGEPLHWARDKSMDHADCVARHLMDYRSIDTDTGLPHAVAMAWRALAQCELVLEECKKK